MKTKALVLILAAVSIVGLIRLNYSQAGPKSLDELGLGDFIKEEFDYTEVMHELYRHYEFGNASFSAMQYDDAEAHLRVMKFYVNLLPMVRLDKKFIRNQKDQKKFDKFATDLIAALEKTLSKLKDKKYSEAGREISNQMTNMCKYCHNNIRKPYKDPTKFGTKPDFQGYKGGL